MPHRGDDGNGWHYFKVKDIWYWLEQEVYTIYNALLRTARTQRRASLATPLTGNLFDAMEANDTDIRPTASPTYEVTDMKDVLTYVSRFELSTPPRPLKFSGGSKEFTNHYNQRWYGSEIYIDTSPSNYKKVVKKINDDVDGNPKRQARTVRRLLKGYKIQSNNAKVVVDNHLERVAMIWGLSEAARNPSNLAHLLIVLHLVKKGLITWDNAVDETHGQRYVPSVPGEGIAGDLQKLRMAMIQRLSNGTKVPPDLKALSGPFRTNLAQFLESGSAAYTDKVRVSTKYPGQVRAQGKDPADAWATIRSILNNKILNHLK